MGSVKEIHRLELNAELYNEEHKALSLNFDVGNIEDKEVFNDFIQKDALKSTSNGDGVTYIITNTIREGNNEIVDIVGYYCISTFALYLEDDFDYHEDSIPEDDKRMHYTPRSAFLINMFAINEKYQDTIYNGKLISDMIMEDIVGHLYDLSVNVVGGKFIILCSVPNAISFYKRNNFTEFDNDMTIFDKYIEGTTPMYIKMHKD